MKKVLLLLCTLALILSGCNAGKTSGTAEGETGGEKKSGLERSDTDGDEAAALNQTISWINATNAVLTKSNQLDLKYFGGTDNPKLYEKAAKKSLADYWDITNKEELLNTVEQLCSNQMHNQGFLDALSGLGCDTSMSTESFEQFLKDSGYDESQINFMSAGYQAYLKYGENAIFAWDLSRAVHLLGFGYLSGFLSYEEALDPALEAALKIQSSYDSWDAFWDSYLMGYVYWSEELMTDPDSGYAERIEILKDLRSGEDSPFRLDWNLELSKEW